MTIALVVLSSNIAFLGSPASATEHEEHSEFVESLQKVAPGLLEESTQNSAIETMETGSSSLTIVADDRKSATGGAEGISMTLPDVAQIDSSMFGVEAFTDTSGNPGVIQELASGFRVIRSISDQGSPSSFEYRLDIPDDAHLEAVAEGFLIISSTGVHGFLLEPWAKDSLGVLQQTEYELAKGVLYQRVEVTKNTLFPVVVDPNWTYSFTYATVSSPNTNWIKIHNCFDCYFPVSGAPQQFPQPNQLLPLFERPNLFILLNMECRMGTVILGTQDFSWSFRATANHVDGFGSRVSFALRYLNNAPKLIVSAFVVNDFLLGNELYKNQAGDNWQDFANNLNTK